MMIARTRRVTQLLGLLVSVTSFAQGYSNPHYHSATPPKKGESVPLPTYGITPSLPPESTESTETSTSSPRSTPSSRASGSSAHTLELAISFDYPNGLGDAGQSLKPKYGGNLAVYLQPLIDPMLKNYVSIGWDVFSLKADSNAKLNILPVMVGLDLATRDDQTFSPSFGIAVGGAGAWLSVPNSQTMSGKGYFAAAIKPGLDIHCGGFSILLQTPIQFLIGGSKMTYINYSAGVRFGL